MHVNDLFCSKLEVAIHNFCKEKGITEINDPYTSIDPFGKPYVSLGFGGIVAEGAINQSISFTEEATNNEELTAHLLVEAYMTKLKEFVGDNNLIIWRRQPTLAWEINDFRTVRFNASSRLTAHTVNFADGVMGNGKDY